jgi:nicotinamide phosphoribosyltransferase
MAAKGAWFEVEEEFYASSESLEPGIKIKQYNIYKDPITDDGVKKSLKGLLAVTTESLEPDSDEKIIVCYQECTPEEESKGLLQTIYENGKFYNSVTFSEIRKKLLNL